MLQFPSVLTEAKGISREAQQVPGEPKAAQTTRVWKAKQKAPREVEAQLHFSREDKGKMLLNFGSIASREADLEPQGHELLLSSPNPRALVPSANFAPMSGVKKASLCIDSIANAALVPKGTNKVLSREAGTEALCSAKYLRSKARSRSPLHVKGEVTISLLPKSSGTKFAPGGGATSITPPSEVNKTDKVIFKSPKNRSLIVVPQPEQQNTRSSRVSVQDRISLVDTDLREFLTNKRKLELLHISPSCCSLLL